MKTSCSLLILALGGMFIAGCDPSESKHWQLSVEQEQGHLALDCEKFRILFDGIELNGPPGRGGASVSLKIKGSGTSIYNLYALDNTITISYSAGANTITLKQYELKIFDDGTRLQIGNSNIDLGVEKQTVVVHADGTIDEQ